MHASRDICLVLLCQTGRWLLDDSLPKSSYNLADRCAKLNSPLEDFRCRTSPPSPKSPRKVGFSAARSCQHAELLCVNPRASWIWMVFGALRGSEQSHQSHRSHQGFWKRVGTCRDSIFVWWKRWVSNGFHQETMVNGLWLWLRNPGILIYPDVLACLDTLGGEIGIKSCKMKPWF